MQVSTGEKKRIGGPRLYCSLSTSPDAQFLLVAWLERPFSYNVPCGRFPKRIQVWDRFVPTYIELGTTRSKLQAPHRCQKSGSTCLQAIELHMHVWGIEMLQSRSCSQQKSSALVACLVECLTLPADRAGNVVREVAQLPLAEDIPITLQLLPQGPPLHRVAGRQALPAVLDRMPGGSFLKG